MIPPIFCKSADEVYQESCVNDLYKFDETKFMLTGMLEDGVNDDAKHMIFMWCAFMLDKFGIRITPDRELFLVEEPMYPYLSEKALDDDVDIALKIVTTIVNNLFHIGAPRLAVAVVNVITSFETQIFLMTRGAYTIYRKKYVSLCVKYFNLEKKQYDTESKFFTGWKGNYLIHTTYGRTQVGCCKHGLFRKIASGEQRCFISFIQPYEKSDCDKP